jgi:MFS family permease
MLRLLNIKGIKDNYLVTFLACSINAFLLSLQWGIAIGFLPIYVRELGGSYIEVALIFTSFASLRVVFSPFWGYLSDRSGKRKPFIGFASMLIAPIFITIALTKLPLQIIALRASTGILTAAAIPVSISLVVDIAQPANFGKVIGWFSTIQWAGFAFGNLIGGFLADLFGYEFLWYLSAFACILGSLIFFALAKEPILQKETKRKEIKQNIPLKERLSGKLMLTSFAYAFFIMSYSVIGPNFQTFLVEELSVSRGIIGIILSLQLFAQIVFQPKIGSYTDKVGRKRVILLSCVIPIVAILSIYYSTFWIGLAFIGNSLFGLAMGMYLVSGTALIADISSSSKRGRSLGIFQSFEAVGRAGGPVVGGIIATVFSLRSMILSAITFPLLSLLLMVNLKEERRS